MNEHTYTHILYTLPHLIIEMSNTIPMRVYQCRYSSNLTLMPEFKMMFHNISKTKDNTKFTDSFCNAGKSNWVIIKTAYL